MTSVLLKDSIEQHALSDYNSKQYAAAERKGKIIKG